MTPRVTIGIPTYSRFAMLQEAVASALALEGHSFEVLISDDGETPEIRRWSEALAVTEPRVRYQHNTSRLGLAGNWNAVLDASRGEFVVIIGDDDRLLPDFLEALVPLMEPDVDVAFCSQHFIDQQGRRLPEVTERSNRDYGRNELQRGVIANPEAVVWRNSVPMSAALLRTAVVKGLRFREDLNTPEIELFLRLAQGGGRFAFCPEFHCEYRVHPGSATSAGLLSERLAERLLSLPANPAAEPWRTRFLSALLIDSVGRCLLSGNHAEARKFIEHGEYRAASRRLVMWVQRFCAALPSTSGVPLYRILHRWKTGR